ncbi:pneumococcal-type histidine triad protein [Dolosigranulum pigrum]|uniref:pneumococcal-type histidine triad protein n=1 Tax=Dolosigranulum pigrum TaxID=29394 RepID=UPI001AD8741E|nr:pneumococcal-type histidine triad protein [Dolosigranulum pigrum]QTJ54103.1 pneumococcal-type histidine triad protein [Dolosigranulum pigrum]
MEKTNIKKIILGSLASAVIFGGGYYTNHLITGETDNSSESGIQYIESSKSAGATSEKTPEQVSHDEAIDAEQIVVKIMDDGYVTSHGDHYHFFSGKVPFDAIISEELVIKDYELNEDDIISEHQDGYIVKVKGEYYLYLKEPDKAKNVRTKEEIAEQQKITGLHDGEGKQSGGGNDHGHAPLSPEVKKQVSQAKASGRYTTDDGYVFTAGSIVRDTGDAYIVAHDDHFHYVPKAHLSASELAAARAFLGGGGGSSHAQSGRQNNTTGGNRKQSPNYAQQGSNRPSFNPQPGQKPQAGNQSQGHQHNNGQTGHSKRPDKAPSSSDLKALVQKVFDMDPSKRHKEGDGLVFNPLEITDYVDGFGFVQPHGDHHHVIPEGKLSDAEKEAAHAVVNARKAGQKLPKMADKPSKGQSQPQKPQKPNKEESPKQPEKPSKEEKPSDSADNKGQEKPGKEESTDDHGEHHESTPQSERKGKPNSQIVYSPEEIAKAKAAGKYTTSDGYIFDAKDIDRKAGNGYIVPHMDHTHYIPIKDLSPAEQKAAEEFLASKGKKPNETGQSQAEKPQKPTKPNKEEKPKDKDDNSQPDSGQSNVTPEKEQDSQREQKPQVGNQSQKPGQPQNQGQNNGQANKPGRPDKAPSSSDLKALVQKVFDMDQSQRHKEGDGLVFNPLEVTEYIVGEGFIQPHGDHHHIIPESELSDAEKEAAHTVVNARKAGQKLPNMADKPSKGQSQPQKPNKPADDNKGQNKPGVADKDKEELPKQPEKPSDSSDNKEPEKPAEDNKGQEKPGKDSNAVDPKKDPLAYYESLKAELVIKPADLPYNLQYLTEYVEGLFIIPHHDHYHNISVQQILDNDSDREYFLKGHSAEDVLKTAKYLAENPDARPKGKDGWGDSAGEEPAEVDELADEKKMDYLAEKYGVDRNDFSQFQRIINTVTITKDGESIDINLSDLKVEGDKVTPLVELPEFGQKQGEKPADSADNKEQEKPGKEESTDDHGENHKSTPQSERKGKPNSQIVYSPEEIAKAKAAGKYTTSDGYIFDANDIERKAGNGYVVPHMNHTHYIPIKDLSPAEQKAAEEILKARGGDKKQEKPENPSEQPTPGEDDWWHSEGATPKEQKELTDEKKMQYLADKYKVDRHNMSEFFRLGEKVTITKGDESIDINLSDLKVEGDKVTPLVKLPEFGQKKAEDKKDEKEKQGPKQQQQKQPEKPAVNNQNTPAPQPKETAQPSAPQAPEKPVEAPQPAPEEKQPEQAPQAQEPKQEEAE